MTCKIYIYEQFFFPWWRATQTVLFPPDKECGKRKKLLKTLGFPLHIHCPRRREGGPRTEEGGEEAKDKLQVYAKQAAGAGEERTQRVLLFRCRQDRRAVRSDKKRKWTDSPRQIFESLNPVLILLLLLNPSAFFPL